MFCFCGPGAADADPARDCGQARSSRSPRHDGQALCAFRRGADVAHLTEPPAGDDASAVDQRDANRESTAFLRLSPEDAKSYPNKMLGLSGFRDATTAGNLRRQKSSGNPLHQALTCRSGRPPKRTSGCLRRHEGPVFHWPISSFT